MRLLVTGSRDWGEEVERVGPAGELTTRRTLRAIEQEFHLLSALWSATKHSTSVTLVHGACPTGADHFAAAHAERMGWTVEAHPADWSQGRGAGPERNKRMVALGADLCLAFPFGASRGTRGCMVLAEKAGIPVRVFEPPA